MKDDNSIGEIIFLVILVVFLVAFLSLSGKQSIENKMATHTTFKVQGVEYNCKDVAAVDYYSKTYGDDYAIIIMKDNTRIEVPAYNIIYK